MPYAQDQKKENTTTTYESIGNGRPHTEGNTHPTMDTEYQVHMVEVEVEYANPMASIRDVVPSAYKIIPCQGVQSVISIVPNDSETEKVKVGVRVPKWEEKSHPYTFTSTTFTHAKFRMDIHHVMPFMVQVV